MGHRSWVSATPSAEAMAKQRVVYDEITIRLPYQLAELVRGAADQAGISLSEQIKRMLVHSIGVMDAVQSIATKGIKR